MGTTAIVENVDEPLGSAGVVVDEPQGSGAGAIVDEPLGSGAGAVVNEPLG